MVVFLLEESFVWGGVPYIREKKDLAKEPG